MEHGLSEHYYTFLVVFEGIRYMFYGWFAVAFWLLLRAQRRDHWANVNGWRCDNCKHTPECHIDYTAECHFTGCECEQYK